MLTKDVYIKALERVKSFAEEDPVEAHICEDEAKNKFISDLAERDDKIGEIAKVLVKITDIDYTRWYN